MSAVGIKASGNGTRRLWSLWEMIWFNANPVFYLSKEIGRLTTVLGALDPNDFRPEETKKNDAMVIGGHKTQFVELGFRMCAAQVDRIVESCQANEYLTVRDMVIMMHELGNRILDESLAMNFLCLSPSQRDLYEPTIPLFGTDVEDKIPSVIADISEAGKCLGLERPTAAVFHLMRVMETGVQKFGDKVGVTLTDEKVWQVILDQLNAEIRRMGKDHLTKKYASISAHLYNVKLAWRNEAMHPKATYTPEEAERIFAATRGFMIDLAGVLY